MNPATRERKRAKDREAQRVSRERTKAYITHLETVVAELRQSSQKELGSTVEEQFKQQRKEIERLQRTVHKIARLAQSVASPGQAADSGASKEELDEEDDVHMSPLFKQPSPTSRSREDSNPHKQTPSPPSVSTPESPPDSDAWKEKVMHGISPTDPTATSFLSSLMPNNRILPNMFAALNGVITALQFCHGTTPQLTEAQDDDITIRAVMFGWDTVEEGELDVVWRAIRSIDRRLYGRCRMIEKVGMLRILRAMLVVCHNPPAFLTCHSTTYLLDLTHTPHQKIVYTAAKTRTTIPAYMNPTALQATKTHPPLVDLIIWPSLRDLMLAMDCTYSSQDACLNYAEVLRFNWPHDTRDVYKITRHDTSSLSNLPPTPASTASSTPLPQRRREIYSFTHEYETHYASLTSWSLKPGSKCLFQRPPRLNLNYCDFLGEEAMDSDDGDGDRVRGRECCFLYEAEVTTVGKESEEGEVFVGRVDRAYEATLETVYPNILMDM